MYIYAHVYIHWHRPDSYRSSGGIPQKTYIITLYMYVYTYIHINTHTYIRTCDSLSTSVSGLSGSNETKTTSH